MCFWPQQCILFVIHGQSGFILFYVRAMTTHSCNAEKTSPVQNKFVQFLQCD